MKDKITFWSWCACVIQSDISSLQCFFIDKCPICNSWNWLRLCKNRFWNWAKKQQLLVVEDCYQGHFHFHKTFWWRTEMLLKLLGLSNWKAKWQKVNQWKFLNINLHIIRSVGRSENLEVLVVFGGHNLSPLVEIGLTDLPKSGGAITPPGTPRDDRPAFIVKLCAWSSLHFLNCNLLY